MCDEVFGVDMRVVRRALDDSSADKVHHDRQTIILSRPSWSRDTKVKTILTYVRRLVKERRDSGLELRTGWSMRRSVDFTAIWRVVWLRRSKASLSGGVMGKFDVVKVLHRVPGNTSIRDFALVEPDNRLRKDASGQRQA